MKPTGRFLLNFLSPPAIAATLIATVASLHTASAQAFALLPIMLLVAYLYAGLPSLAHALLLQRCYRRGHAPQGKRALAVSTLNGLVAGFAIYLFFVCIGGFAQALGLLLLLPLGAATGAVNALLHGFCRRGA